MSKGETSQRIRTLIEFDPKITDASIARALSITRQAVGYHTRIMGKYTDLNRERFNRSCSGCGTGIQKKSRTGLCRKCLVRSYEYQYICYQCGEEHIRTGPSASVRRYRRAAYGEDLKEFCDAQCAGKYQANKNWDRRRANNMRDERSKLNKAWAKEISNDDE